MLGKDAEVQKRDDKCGTCSGAFSTKAMLNTHRIEKTHLSQRQASTKMKKAGRKGKSAPPEPQRRRMPAGKKARTRKKKKSIAIEEEEEEAEDEVVVVVEADVEAGDGDVDSAAGTDKEERDLKCGEIVWVCDEVPTADDGEGDQSWDVFKATMDKIELGREGEDVYCIKLGQEFWWYSFDRLDA
jgi:hypothetical protein